MFDRYWMVDPKDEDPTPNVLKKGYYYTGDCGDIDEHGYQFLLLTFSNFQIAS